MKKAKKIISLFCTVALVLSMFVIIPTVSAETYTEYTALNTIAEVNTAMTGKSSIIGGRTAKIFSNEKKSGPVNHVDITSNILYNKGTPFGNIFMTDGNAATMCYLETNYTDCTIKSDIEYDLGTGASVTGFILASQYDTGYGARVFLGAYDVYLSDSYDTLYNAENKIFSYNAANGASYGQNVTFNTTYTGRYFAVRITKSLNDADLSTRSFSRIGELAVYGTNGYDFVGVSYADAATFLNGKGASLLNGKTATIYSVLRENGTYNRTDITSSILNNGGTANSYMTDSNVTTRCDVDTTTSEPRTIQADVEYFLGPNKTINGFFISGQEASGYGDKLYLGAYEVYVSNSKNNLYDESNRVFAYGSKTASGASYGQYISFDTAKTGCYIAVRITKTTNDIALAKYCFARVSEIAVYGSNNNTYTAINSLPTYDELAAYGTSIIAGKQATVYSNQRANSAPVREDITASLLNITDCDYKSTANSYMTDGYANSDCYLIDINTGAPRPIKADVEYDLGRSCTVNGFTVIGEVLGTIGNKIYLGAYDVYMSDDLATLYDDENMIFTYNSAEAVTLGQHVTLDTPRTGQYFAVRITKSAYDQNYSTYLCPRVGEIAVYGDNGLNYTVEYRKEAKLADFITDEDFAALGTDLMAGKTGVPYALDTIAGTHTAITGNAVSTQNLDTPAVNLGKLTDGKVYDGTSNITSQMFYKGGSELPALDLEYNLGSNCSIDKFALLGLSFVYEDNLSYSAGYYTGKYQVYLSSTKEDLYNADNMIYSYDSTENGVSRGQIVSFKETVTGKYLAIRILNAVTTATSSIYARLSEIAVFGDDGLDYTVEYRNEQKINDMLTDDQFSYLGKDYLKGLTATPYTDNGGTTERKCLVGNATPEDNLEQPETNLSMLTDGKVFDSSNNIVAELRNYGSSELSTIDLEYDLGQSRKIKKFLLLNSSVVDDYNTNYYVSSFTAKYEVYFAENQADLYNPGNLVYSYDVDDSGISRGQIVKFDTYCQGRYLAVKILKPTISQEDYAMPRISEIAVFGIRNGDVTGDGNIALDDIVRLKKYFAFGNSVTVDEIGADADENGNVESLDLAEVKKLLLANPINAAAVIADRTFEYDSAIQETGTDVGTSSTRTVNIDTDKVVYSNFMSLGANLTSGILTSEGKTATGMNNTYFEVEKKRYLSAKPQFNRFIIPVDYLVTNTEANPSRSDWVNNADYINYKNGVYDFNSEGMNGVYEYLNLIKQGGGKVYINFGWANATRIQSWFSQDASLLHNGAPAEPEYFAEACAALMNELINNRHYNNIIGVSVYNEVNSAAYRTNDDDKNLNYVNLIDAVSDELTEKGITGLTVMGPEFSRISVNNFSLLDYLNTSAVSGVFGAFTAHNYYSSACRSTLGGIIDYRSNYNLGSFLSQRYNKPIYFSEFNTGNYDYDSTVTHQAVEASEGGKWTWDTSDASYLISMANTGISGASRWSYSGQYWTNPFEYGSYSNNYQSLWMAPLSLNTVSNGVLDKYYEDSLITNYVKAGSNVLDVNWTGEDTRVSAFELPDGNYTFIVEVNESNKSREINLNFDKSIGKNLYRMSFSHDVVNNGNATIPSCEKVFSNAGSSITDTVGSGYAYYVYTTCTPVKQVELDKVSVECSAGETVQFTSSFVDCSATDEIEWSISANDGGHTGTVDQNGYYTAASDAVAGDMVAVKASLKSDASVYAIAIIKIK